MHCFQILEANIDSVNTTPRREAISLATSVVVKVGTRVLTGPTGKLDRDRINCLSAGLCAIADSGRQVVMVSSGAVGAGMGKLGLSDRPVGVAQLQAVAAVGQADLIQAYEVAFAERGYHAAQVLLTRNDLQRRDAYLHVRNALLRIHDLGAIAVVNENDSVSVTELMTTFGDNDTLAAQVAGLLESPLLVILSDVDGLYDGSPDDPTSNRISVVENLDDEVLGLASDKKNSLSKGGMASKLAASQLANSHGQSVIIGPGRDDQVLQKILAGDEIGTLFVSNDRFVRGRRRWIGASAQIEGTLVLDDGAVKALQHSGRSLLAIGITALQGDFESGAVVSLVDQQQSEIARGLCNYSAHEVREIKGLSSDQIAAALGHRPYESVVHRDNMVLTIQTT